MASREMIPENDPQENNYLRCQSEGCFKALQMCNYWQFCNWSIFFKNIQASLFITAN